jgi:hypothetical protein
MIATTSLQRQLPGQIQLDATFMNIGRDLPFSSRPNLMDPALNYQNKAELDRRVDNPFYQYLTPGTFPGPLRNQRQVLVRDLLTPYPHYGAPQPGQYKRAAEPLLCPSVAGTESVRSGLQFPVAYNYNRRLQHRVFQHR